MQNDIPKYATPTVQELGSVEKMTEAFDKVGSAADIFTPAIPVLDGDVLVDPGKG
jgi:hypothetical protein